MTIKTLCCDHDVDEHPVRRTHSRHDWFDDGRRCCEVALYIRQQCVCGAGRWVRPSELAPRAAR